MFLQPEELPDPVSHKDKRRYQHPKPPAIPDGPRQHNRDDDKRNAHEEAFERLFDRQLPTTPRPADPVNFSGWLWLHELTRESLRHQADIRSATATKTRAIEVLGSALRTEHLFSAFHVECSLASR